LHNETDWIFKANMEWPVGAQWEMAALRVTRFLSAGKEIAT
jgi:hypothetical protein